MEVDLGAAQCAKPFFRFFKELASEAGALMRRINRHIVQPTAMAVVAHHDRSDNLAVFLADEGPRLAAMAALVLLGLPLLVWLNSAVQHQTLLGNFPMRIRWNVHRYLLRQSMGYFQDEFAGRIATKLMQTSLAVRETVVKLLDIGNYVLVYFGGTLVVAGGLAADAAVRRLAALLRPADALVRAAHG